MPEFRVGYLGRGIGGMRRLPFMQYDFPEHEQWGETRIEQVWKDFSAGEDGVIFSLWDASRMLWFGRPQNLGNPQLERFLGGGRSFDKWGYFPVDAVGPDLKGLPTEMRAAVSGYDRVLAASQFGQRVIDENLVFCDWLPHGLLDGVFQYQPCEEPEQINVGCVMTNQARKDWPVAFQTAHLLKDYYGNRLGFWTHSDVPINYWNLYALADEYDVKHCWCPSFGQLTDKQLATMYSESHCTFLPSGGEGFGYPIAESLACDTPCVVTDYAAGAELVEPECRAKPLSFRVDTMHCVNRAILNPNEFAIRIIDLVDRKQENWGAGVFSQQVDHLRWSKLRVVWEKWFREGLHLD